MNKFKKILVTSLLFNAFFIGTSFAENVDVPAKKQPTTEKTDLIKKIVNINTANIENLQTLKGIGHKKAQDIVDYRTKHGTFKKIDDLKSVPGFTNKTVTKLQNDNPGIITTESN